MRLSKHFTLEEFVKSAMAFDRDINNNPGIVEIINLCALCHNILEPVRKQFGPVIITSGYRNFELNRALGSKDTSQHIRGEAGDWKTKDAPLDIVFKWCIKNLIFDQLIFEAARNVEWIHSSYTINGQNRKESLLYDGLIYKEINNG